MIFSKTEKSKNYVNNYNSSQKRLRSKDEKYFFMHETDVYFHLDELELELYLELKAELELHLEWKLELYVKLELQLFTWFLVEKKRTEEDLRKK